MRDLLQPPASLVQERNLGTHLMKQCVSPVACPHVVVVEKTSSTTEKKLVVQSLCCLSYSDYIVGIQRS
jgi:hypothetical protein